MYIKFADSEDVFGMIETKVDVEIIKRMLEVYRGNCLEDYNIDDFFLFLKDKKIEFKEMPINSDVTIHF